MATISVLSQSFKRGNVMFSRPVLGKSKMSWFEYIFKYCIPTGFQNIRYSFINWMDLVWFEDNHKYYAFLPNDDPFEQCKLYFWDELNEEPYSKEFIQELYRMSDEIDRGEVELIPFSHDMLFELEELLNTIDSDT
jgi:hypothetical protein